jgi:nitrate/nitrite transporter NarK
METEVGAIRVSRKPGTVVRQYGGVIADRAFPSRATFSQWPPGAGASREILSLEPHPVSPKNR